MQLAPFQGFLDHGAEIQRLAQVGIAKAGLPPWRLASAISKPAIEYLDGSFRDEDIGAVLLADGDDRIHGFFQFPEAAGFHLGAQQLQGARHSLVVHVLSCQQPQYFQEIAFVEIGEGEFVNITVQELISPMGPEAHLVV